MRDPAAMLTLLLMVSTPLAWLMNKFKTEYLEQVKPPRAGGKAGGKAGQVLPRSGAGLGESTQVPTGQVLGTDTRPRKHARAHMLSAGMDKVVAIELGYQFTRARACASGCVRVCCDASYL